MLKKFDEAITDALRAINLNPENLKAYKTLIQAKKCLDKPNDVITFALQAIKVAPNVSSFYSEIAYAKSKLNQYQEDVKHIETPSCIQRRRNSF